MLSGVAEGIAEFFLQAVYGIWTGGAWVVGLAEDIFMLFVGIKGHEAHSLKGTEQSDITSFIINNPQIKGIFNNLVALATILLIFFTILQIIREHYKDKNGGNPYVLVFRMVKAMVLFMFISAACVIGLYFSSVVLQALYAATGGGQSGVGGVLFKSMAGSGNRITQAVQGEEVDDANIFSGIVAANRTDKEWVWFGGGNPKIYYGGNPDDLYEGGMGCEDPLHFLGPLFHKCEPPEIVKERNVSAEFIALPEGLRKYTKSGGTFINEYKNSEGEGLPVLGGNQYLYSQMMRFNIANLFHYSVETGTSDFRLDTRIAVINKFGLSDWHMVGELYKNYLNIYVLDSSGKAQITPRYLFDATFTWVQHKGFLGVQTKLEDDATFENAARWDANTGRPVGLNEDGQWVNNSYSETQYVYYFITTDQYGKPITPALQDPSFGQLSGSYFYVKQNNNTGAVVPNLPGDTNNEETLLGYFERRTGIGWVPKSPTDSTLVAKSFADLNAAEKGSYANWIDDLMSRRPPMGEDVAEDLWFYNDEVVFGDKHTHPGPMHYNNFEAVKMLYDIASFNWILGFGGLFIALGVYNSFLFGMIQRILELGILYVFSPVTLAFFPFDDGAQFNSSFVKPFYKKAISSYAPVISLNLFFVAVGAFSGIKWFDDSASGYGFVFTIVNTVTTSLVTIALLSMLPKVRTTIQTMLGADPMEEKKFFGKGGVFDNAKNLATKGVEKALGAASAINQTRTMSALRRDVQKRSTKEGRARLREEDKKNYGNGGWLSRRREQARQASDKRNASLDAGREGSNRSRFAQALKENRAKRKIKKKGIEALMDDALGKGSIDDKLKAINSNKYTREKAFRELGRAKNLSGNELENFVKGKMDKNERFGRQDYDNARSGQYRDANGNMQNSRFGKRLQTREETLNAKYQDDYNKKIADERARRQAEQDKKALDIINNNEELKRRFGNKLRNKKPGEDITPDELRQLYNNDKVKLNQQLRKHGMKEGWKPVTTKEVEQTSGIKLEVADKNKIQAASTSKRQNELNQKQIDEMKKRGAFNIYKNKDGESRFHDKETGELKQGDELLTEFNNAIADGTVKQKYTAFGQDLKGKFAHGLHTAGKLATPWGMVDAVQGKLFKAMDKNTRGGAIMTALFDPDNGFLMQGKIPKMLDALSYSKTFRDLDKWEKGRATRLGDEAYADARIEMGCKILADIAAEKQIQKEKIVKRETTIGGTTDTKAQEYYEKCDKEAQAARTEMGDKIGEKATGKKENYQKIKDEVLEPYKDQPELKKAKEMRMNEILDRGGDEKAFVEVFGEKGRELHRMREKCMKDEEFMKELQPYRQKISDFNEAEVLCKGKNNEWLSQTAYVQSFDKRNKDMDEQEAKFQRILGMDPSVTAAIGELRATITDENGQFISAFREFEKHMANKELPAPVVNINGKQMTLDSNDAFTAFQKESFASYHELVKKNTDRYEIAFRDYGEKTGDRLEGIKSVKMADELAKVMHNTVQNTSIEGQQIFRDNEFVRLLEKSQWQTLAQELAKASRGEETKFDQTILSGIKDKSELANLGDMFRNMMGNANGEMRGEGAEIASNILAQQLRMHFIDGMVDSLQTTGNMFDQSQQRAQESVRQLRGELTAMKSMGAQWQRDLLAELDLAMISDQHIDGDELEKMQKKVLKKLNDMQDIDPMARQTMEQKLNGIFSSEMADRNLRRETNSMKWRIRQLQELDFHFRSYMDRKDDRRSFMTNNNPWGW